VVAGPDEFGTRPAVPRQREPLVALPQAPHSSNGGQRNGTTRATLYRELSTTPRPAIGGPPSVAVPIGGEPIGDALTSDTVSTDMISPTSVVTGSFAGRNDHGRNDRRRVDGYGNR